MEEEFFEDEGEEDYEDEDEEEFNEEDYWPEEIVKKKSQKVILPLYFSLLPIHCFQGRTAVFGTIYKR